MKLICAALLGLIATLRPGEETGFSLSQVVSIYHSRKDS